MGDPGGGWGRTQRAPPSRARPPTWCCRAPPFPPSGPAPFPPPSFPPIGPLPGQWRRGPVGAGGRRAGGEGEGEGGLGACPPNGRAAGAGLGAVYKGARGRAGPRGRRGCQRVRRAGAGGGGERAGGGHRVPGGDGDTDSGGSSGGGGPGKAGRAGVPQAAAHTSACPCPVPSPSRSSPHSPGPGSPPPPLHWSRFFPAFPPCPPPPPPPRGRHRRARAPIVPLAGHAALTSPAARRLHWLRRLGGGEKERAEEGAGTSGVTTWRSARTGQAREWKAGSASG